MSLKKTIDGFKSKAIPQIPEAIITAMQQSGDVLRASGLAGRALGTGDTAAEFTLPNATGKPVSLETLRQNGPVVISFYRGGWCPYCNLEFKALNDILGEIKALGASLVAVSPQLPDETLSTAEKSRLEFEVLSDVGSKVSDQYGLTFSLDAELRPIYKNWGADVAVINGDPDCKLPLPATYVIARDGRIADCFVEEDYTQRMEPADILNALRNLAGR